MRWWQWVLVLLLLAGAVRALIPAPDREDPLDLAVLDEQPPLESDTPESGVDPSLRGSPVPAPAATGPQLPDAIRTAAADLRIRAHAERVLAWLLEDPQNLRTLLAVRLAALPPHAENPESKAWRAALAGPVREMVRAWGTGVKLVGEFWKGLGELPPLQASIDALLADPTVEANVQGALLGLRYQLPPLVPGPWALMRSVASDAGRHPGVRAYALKSLVAPQWRRGDAAVSPLTEADIAAIRSLFTADLPVFWQQQAAADLQALAKFPDALESVLSARVANSPGPGALRTLMARGLRSTQGRYRKKLLDALYGGDVDAVLAWMETASAHARIVGVRRLHARKVDPERLHAHVVAVLASKDTVAAQLAVDAISLVHVPDRDVIEAVEGILGGKDAERQRLGVKALGALAYVPGAHDAAIRRLGAVAREAPSPRVRITTVHAILMHQAHPRLMIEALGGMLADTEPDVRREAADALGELAGSHAEARRALEGARTDSDDDVRELIAYWLDASEDDGD